MAEEIVRSAVGTIGLITAGLAALATTRRATSTPALRCNGAYPRTTPGLRLTLSTLFCRAYMRPQERYDEIVTDEVLDRNPPRFRSLVGRDVPTGWRTVADADRIVALGKANAPLYYRTRSGYA